MPTGTCQICERRIGIRTSDRVLYKHGHGKTSGGGFTPGHCQGSFELPYELSSDLCKQFQRQLYAELNAKNTRLTNLQSGVITQLFSDRDGKDIQPGHPSWNRVFNGAVQLLELEIAAIRRNIQTMEKLIDNWELKDIRGL
jgi:hypothetical protein